MKVPYSYITQKFLDSEAIIRDIRALLCTGDFTLGAPLREFEERFAKLIGVRHAIGVANGTDALRIALKANGVGPGAEVIAPANTFIASVGAIVECGATPVLVDVDWTNCIDAGQIHAAITPKTKAILPVHFMGAPAEMQEICQLADEADIAVVEDACQAICAQHEGVPCGGWGQAAAFSLHPLKNLNVWGDGGVITTDDDRIAAWIRLHRNHGLKDRDTVTTFGCNSRLDTLHAIVANHHLAEVEAVTKKRRENAAYFTVELARLAIEGHLSFPDVANSESCFHLYMIYVHPDVRNLLVRRLNEAGIEVKVHYPIPLYQQPAFRYLGYSAGDFPVADEICASCVTLPVHEYLTEPQKSHIVETIRGFFNGGSGAV